MQFLENSLIELITQTSTNLPPDVRAVVGEALASETPGTQASQALNIIASNIDMAAADEGPICQDTGMPTFFVHTPIGVSQIAIKKAIRAAVAEATRRGKLRPNSVDSITGMNVLEGLDSPCINVSCVTGAGLEEVKDAIRSLIWGGEIRAEMLQVMINSRHQDALQRARTSIQHSLDALRGDVSVELVALDLRIGVNAVGEVVGKTTTEDLLDSIFSQFCIGK